MPGLLLLFCHVFAAGLSEEYRVMIIINIMFRKREPTHQAFTSTTLKSDRLGKLSNWHVKAFR